MPWIPLKSSDLEYDETLDTGVSWDGDNLVATAYVPSGGDAAVVLDLSDEFLANGDIQVRITVPTFFQPTQGAGNNFFYPHFIYDATTLVGSGYRFRNESPPYPASVWDVDDITEYDPSSDTYTIESIDNACIYFFPSFYGAQADFEFLVEIFAPDPIIEFWENEVGATEGDV